MVTSIMATTLLALVMIVLATPALIKNHTESKMPIGGLVFMLAIGMFIVEIAATTYINLQMCNSYVSVSILFYYSTGFWVYNLGLLLASIGAIIHGRNNLTEMLWGGL